MCKSVAHRDLAGNTESLGPAQTSWVSTCIITGSPGCYCVRQGGQTAFADVRSTRFMKMCMIPKSCSCFCHFGLFSGLFPNTASMFRHDIVSLYCSHFHINPFLLWDMSCSLFLLQWCGVWLESLTGSVSGYTLKVP